MEMRVREYYGWLCAALALAAEVGSQCVQSCGGCVAEAPCSFCKRDGGLTTMCLSGSMEEMGEYYGSILSKELADSFAHLQAEFGGAEEMIGEALLFDERYSSSFRGFLRGVADGSGLPLPQILILNAMETLTKSSKPREEVGSLKTACLFANIPAAMTRDNASILLRNYDFPSPFDRISRNLVVAVIKAQDKIPAAIIGMPGQIYCPTCVNQRGLFLQLNNGMPSGGYQTNFGRRTMLIRMLELMQDSETLGDVSRSLRASQSDYSLILNAASPLGVASHEFSSFNGSRQLSSLPLHRAFVSTNFFQAPEWGLPQPSNLQSWWAPLRRQNMQRLLAESSEHSMESLEAVMDLPMAVGGSKWSLTIYQIIFRPQDLRLSIRSIAKGIWNHIDLANWL